MSSMLKQYSTYLRPRQGIPNVLKLSILEIESSGE
jgi:hypothetical protein